MSYKQVCRLCFLGIDDELKDDTSSVYSTNLNSSFYPIPPGVDTKGNPLAVFKVDGNGATEHNTPLAFKIRNNTKRLRFSLNGAFNDLKLSNKAKLVIESVTLPNIINMTFRQSKCVGNILLRLHGLNRANSWDSSSQKKAAPTIFTTPVKLNLQGFGSQTDGAGTNSPAGGSWDSFGKLNGDNNGNLYINPDPQNLYNFNIGDKLLDTFEFEFIYDMAYCRFIMRAQNADDKPVEQQLILKDDKDDLEGFQITFIVMDVEEDDDKLYNEKDLLNKINHLIYRK